MTVNIEFEIFIFNIVNLLKILKPLDTVVKLSYCRYSSPWSVFSSNLAASSEEPGF